MKSYLFFSLVVILLAATATAQPELVQDGMGFFFDTEATTYCEDYDPAPGYIQFTAYLVLINPSTDQPELIAWEARLEIEANPSVPVPSAWTVIGNNMFPSPCMGGDCIVGAIIPFANPATVLAHITLSYLGNEVDPYCTISIERIPGSLSFAEGPGYTAEISVPIPANPIVGTWGEPSAWINHPDGPCDVVANEPMTWGAVKSLYEE